MSETKYFRKDLNPLERAVSDTLDEWLSRIHGITSSLSYPQEFIAWLNKRGCVIHIEGKEMDGTDDGVYGNSDTGYFVSFGLRSHGPFNSFEDANDAFDSMLR